MSLLAPDEPAPFDVLRPQGDSTVVLTCEHAGAYVPRALNMLGLLPDDYGCHYAVDIGARDVTLYLSELLNAPAILGNYSRLVVDLNRDIDHPTTFAPTAEGKPVPGNLDLNEQDKAARISEIYDPYQQALAGLLDRAEAAGTVPLVISVHSFTPVFFNFHRPWEIAFMYAADGRLSQSLMARFSARGYQVGDNEPYDHRILKGGAINRHAGERRLPATLVEFRNDMISNEKDAFFWAKLLADDLQEILAEGAVCTYYKGLQLPYDPEKERTYFADLVQRAKRGEP
ncbi:MAG: N-formylglutamate amidohydrolase [Micavibrio aeruginosavorus]|uniref:N-formylglutamate amidohydrolase n=1 Tax=Micavibrio aeruginosavorus TaxID=349221 RepID=A0A7T5UI92_9BACT|nr:MAG: N-formylglutamate amidohydrolase [Micavibrio aeruginosavorus]